MSNGKQDEGKNRLDLVFPSLIEEVGKIRTYGTQKYGDSENWRTIDNPVQRYTAAAMRHFEAFRKGEYFDSESGLPHLAHCACNLMFLLELTKDKEGVGIPEKESCNESDLKKICINCIYKDLLKKYAPCDSCVAHDKFIGFV